jgi:hypothetical protein
MTPETQLDVTQHLHQECDRLRTETRRLRAESERLIAEAQHLCAEASVLARERQSSRPAYPLWAWMQGSRPRWAWRWQQIVAEDVQPWR